MKIEDICKTIEEFAPLHLQQSYDNSGLVVGKGDVEVKGILFAVDVTEKVIEEAIDKNCNLIITHHPIIFHAIKRLNNSSVVERCVEMAIKNDIALYACHTNLDAVRGGMSWRVGEMIGVKNMEVLGEQDSSGNGFGVIGNLEKPIECSAFLENIVTKLNLSVIRANKDVDGVMIRSVAICTGAGRDLIAAAGKACCDIYITADLRYNDFFEPCDKFILADIGHFESEKCAIDILFDIISKKNCTFALHKSELSLNPITYYCLG